MSRLINADELLALIKPITDEDAKWACTGADVKALLVKSITNAPTVDAEPTRHGEWKEWWPGDCALIMTGEEILYECNLCTAKFVDKSRYCPNCGAKMDGDMWDEEDFCSRGERKNDD